MNLLNKSFPATPRKKMHFFPGVLAGLICCCALLPLGAAAQSPSALYTWDVPNDIQNWFRNFGAANTSAVLDNSIPGQLQITETSTSAGGSMAFSDGANRVREGSSSAGGTDVTGLSYLEYEIGHNGSGPVNVQFYAQASTGFSFVALGPDISVLPGVNTYQVPLAGLTPAQAVYVRTFGFNVRDHSALGNLTWTVREVRTAGTPLQTRTLITHDTGTDEGGLQGAIANFDVAAIQGNNGGQNQTGLSHNSAGSGSLEWVDLGGSQGAAISWGNGTAWNGNTFNNRTTDLSNYDTMVVRMSATEVSSSDGGSISVSGYFMANNFQFQSAGTDTLPIDGQFYDLEFDLTGLLNLNSVDQSGINLFAHGTDLRINVDSVTFVPEPQTGVLLLGGILGMAWMVRRRK